ncbi:MAG: hypothetical protein ACYTGN_17470, partial [Planctomycetota bacterium]
MKFGVGAVLGRTFSVWARNVVPFTLLMLVASLPIVAWTHVALSGEQTLDLVSDYHLWSFPAAWLCELVGTAAIVHGVVRQLAGERAGLLGCLGTGLKRFPVVLGVTLM